MTTVRSFAELDGPRRAALFVFIRSLGGSRWFSTCDGMTANYAGATFAGGANHLSAWDGDAPCGALGVITATAAENGEAMLVSPYLVPSLPEVFPRLLEAATAIARAASARRAVLQLDERAAWASALAGEQGFALSHESLTLRYIGGTRPALPDDFAVAPLTAEEAGVYARIDHDAFIASPNGVPITVADLLEQLRDDRTRFFLGRWQGEPVAAAELRLREGEGWIQSLGITPAFQGRGLGRALLRFAVNYLRDCGFGVIRLGVMSANPRALGLYLSEGFERERVASVWLSKPLAD